MLKVAVIYTLPTTTMYLSVSRVNVLLFLAHFTGTSPSGAVSQPSLTACDDSNTTPTGMSMIQFLILYHEYGYVLSGIERVNKNPSFMMYSIF